jgi:methionyl-tRNA formyltransferase
MKKLVQPVKKFAQESGLKVHSFPPDIQNGEFDVGVVASFGHLIPSKLIDKFPRYCSSLTSICFAFRNMIKKCLLSQKF